MFKKYYTGVGSRAIPEHLEKSLTQAATYLEKQGYVLRSGGARGSDEAFERGVADANNKEIYLPWGGFNQRYSEAFSKYDITIDIADPKNKAAIEMAAEFHPMWNRLKDYEKKFMVRNSCQLFGQTMDKPSEFVLCWTPAGQVVGGTGQALRIAKAKGINIINFGNTSLDDISNQLQRLSHV